jgi:hypothetical protein
MPKSSKQLKMVVRSVAAAKTYGLVAQHGVDADSCETIHRILHLDNSNALGFAKRQPLPPLRPVVPAACGFVFCFVFGIDTT